MSRRRLRAFAMAAVLLALPTAALADTFTGTLNIMWGMPKGPASAGGIQYILATADGGYLPLEVTSGANAVLPFNGRPVVVTGRLASRATVASARGASEIVVESIALDPSAPAAVAHDGPPAVTGQKKVIFVLLKFADDFAAMFNDPHPSTFYLNLTNPDTPPGGSTFSATLNGFFKKTSNNLLSWLADVGAFGGVGGGTWIALPQNKSVYAPCNFTAMCFDSIRFDTDAVAAAQAQGIDFTPYDTINFVVSNDLDCCAWGGTITIAGKTYGATWQPAWAQDTAHYAQTMGHALGLPNSGWTYFAYDSPWDTLSMIQTLNGMSCGGYYSRNTGTNAFLECDEPGNGYIMAHRDVLGWIPAANQITVPWGTTAFATLEGGALPVGSGTKLVKVCLPDYSCTGSGVTTRYLTLEARVKNLGAASQFDNAIPGEGIIMHDVFFGRDPIGGPCYKDTRSGWAVPVDATYGDYNTSTCSGTGLFNAQFTPGSTLWDYSKRIFFRFLRRSGSNLSIMVGLLSAYGLDFEGDSSADMTFYRPDGTWRILKSSSNYMAATTLNWGGTGYVPVPGDYDGDTKEDPAVYNTQTGQWLALLSYDNYTTSFSRSWGGPGYQPVPGDYDGDGLTDPAVYVPATGQWLILQSSSGYTASMNVNWGGAGYTAVPGRDFDGDGKSDIVVYRESNGYWYILKSSSNFTTSMSVSWGGHGYTLVPGDYDGDGKADPALYERATGRWLVAKSSTNYASSLNLAWGGLGYDPVPGDYDTDGRFDLGIVQRSTGNWYVLKSGTNFVDSLTVTGWAAPSDTIVSSAIVVNGNDTTRASDFDGDGKADITVYSNTGQWLTLKSSTGFTTSTTGNWGGGFVPAPGDFDGDGRVDLSIYAAASGNWYVLLSSTGFTTALNESAGGGNYVPVVGDYDGDGKSDFAVYNEITSNWYVLESSTGYATAFSVNWGGSGYVAAPGDYDGDGKADLGVYQLTTGNWYVLLSSTNYTTSLNKSAGGPGWTAVPGDYDGDGKTDFVVYSVTGLWYGLESSTSYMTVFTASWGGAGYQPVRGDYDGDGRADLALYQSATGTWSILLSTSGYTTPLIKNWGGAGYTPVPPYP